MSGMPMPIAIRAHASASRTAASGDFSMNSAAARMPTVGSDTSAAPAVPAIIGNGCALPPAPVLLKSDATGKSAENQIAIGLNGSYAVVGADLDGDGDLDAASVAINSQLASFHRNLGTGVFDDGFDSDANKSCWSGSTP